ncbi:hypothetical protein F5Y09DRAFT_306206 [Xylaria sp. FL1042]|nr:hypothetical protein F5Y09DRAFT_306206 [Xylaria sp. FL1042]
MHHQVASRRTNTARVESSGTDFKSTISDITDLPHDVFLLIISYLSPTESVLCRRVSQSWNAAFTSDDVSWNLMRWHFPHVREMRNAAGGADRSAWAHVFLEVARRYFYLRSARPRLIEKIDIGSQRHGSAFQEVEPWHRWLRWNNNVASFQHRDLSWCLEDGLLIYRDHAFGGYVAYDLEMGHRFSVPFDGVGKTVRRIRLAHNILVIEWCEREPYTTLHNREDIHRHFATAFDVQRSTEPGPADAPGSWEIRFRSEWKIHDRGLSVPVRDRFFSAHTATHYVLYLWQYYEPSGNEGPVEQLIVWNIEDASSYRPSEDPSGARIPGPTQPQPRIIKRFTGDTLEFLGIRQGDTPVLREVLLDEANIYVHEEAHRWLAGQHSWPLPPRNHYVRATGIPLSGIGPAWFDECCADGDIHMSFCPRAGSAARFGDSFTGRFDGTWAGRAPCWRHEEFPYLTVSDMVDSPAGVRIVARQCFILEALSAFVLPKISLRAESDYRHEVRFADDMWKELLGKGKIVGDERWVVGEDKDGNITIVRF